MYDGENLLHLEASQAVVRNDRKRNILGAIIPIIRGRAWVELPGSEAKISVSGNKPVFYLQFRQPSKFGYGLARLVPKEDKRVVGEVLITPMTGNLSESQEAVAVSVEELRESSAEGEPVVLRLSPQEPLTPGEYAVVEFLEEGRLNLFVWDFRYQPPPQPDPAR